MSASLIVLIVIGVVALICVGIYNQLVALNNQRKNAFSQIDVQLKRRYDLIPNLVETAKGYLKHERETLEAVIAARNSAITAHDRAAAQNWAGEGMKSFNRAESGLSGALGKLMVVSESYPELKADRTMTNLMEELTSTENKVSFARQGYNDSVMAYNTAREKFPNVFFANAFGFAEAPLFEIENAQERAVPQVKFT